MMEPFQRKYGKVLSGVLSIIPLMTELVWVPSTLISLGTNVPTQSEPAPWSRLSSRVLLFELRWHHERGAGSVLQHLCVDFGGGGHHLHRPGRPLLSRFHRRDPDAVCACWFGEE